MKIKINLSNIINNNNIDLYYIKINNEYYK